MTRGPLAGATAHSFTLSRHTNQLQHQKAAAGAAVAASSVTAHKALAVTSKPTDAAVARAGTRHTATSSNTTAAMPTHGSDSRSKVASAVLSLLANCDNGRPTEVNAAAARLVLRLCGNVNDSGAAGAEPSDMEAGSGGDTTATTTTSNASNTTPTGGDDNGDNGADGDDTTGGGGGGGGGDDSGGGDGGSGGGGAGGGAGAGGGGGDDSASGGSGSDAAKDGEHPIVTLTKPYLDVMKKRLRLIVWDFDKTVLSIHSFHERISPEAVKSGERDIRADWGDLDAFVALSRYLKAQGFIVAVASFGIYETIQAYMDAAFGAGQDLFTRDTISTPECVGVPDGYSVPGRKTPQLRVLISDLKLRTGSIRKDKLHIMFFDDDVKNTDQAVADGFPHSHHVDEPFTTRHWEAALQTLVEYDKTKSAEEEAEAVAKAAAEAKEASEAPAAAAATEK